MTSWPNTQSSFLREMIFGFKKRSKALKHKSSKVTCERVIERDQGIENEKIEISATSTDKKFQFDLHIWDVRWIWISVSENKSIENPFSWAMEGRTLSDNLGPDIVSSFESTLDSAFLNEGRFERTYRNIWERLIATGPKKL